MGKGKFDRPSFIPQTPDPRFVELETKAAKGLLTPQEEGLRRGLFAHPNNPEAQDLVQREHLASLGQAELTPADQGRLQQIRQIEWADRFKLENRTESEGGGPSVSSAATQPTNKDTPHILFLKARIATSLENPWPGDPKTIIDGMIDAMPDNVTVYEDMAPHLMYKNEPSPLELYLLSKVRTMPEMSEEKTERALSVMDSIYSLRDQVRTKKFLLGIRDAVENLDSPRTTTINMCDAGAGALPILAIYAALCSDKVRCSALELNPNSARIAREVVAGFGLSDRITVIEADATSFQPDQPLDFLVSETMHSGLTKEPMVQILSNLQQYVKEDGTILPSGVKIQAGLVSYENYRNPRRFVNIMEAEHQVHDPNWQEVLNYKSGEDLKEINFTLPLGTVPNGNYLLAIGSTVDVGSQHLALHQSLITMPQYLHEGNGELQIFSLKGERSQSGINVKYKPGDTLNGVGKIY